MNHEAPSIDSEYLQREVSLARMIKLVAVADAIQWMIFNNCLQGSLYYLDDFIIVSPNKTSAEFNKQALVSLWEWLGVSMEMSKLEAPSQSIKFLGIDFDTVALQLRLPDDKLQCLKSELARCIQRNTLFKIELESLVGLLQFATKVIHIGHCFLRRLYSMKSISSKPHHHIRLNVPAIAHITYSFPHGKEFSCRNQEGRFRSHFRCIWLLGVWSLLGKGMVTFSMVEQTMPSDICVLLQRRWYQ